MRITTTDPRQRGSQTNDGMIVTMNVSFTGNAINYLSISANEKGINLQDWIWHEQVINGERYYVITDRAISKAIGE